MPGMHFHRHHVRAIAGMAVAASMLILATGCNKRASDDSADMKQTSLAGKPRTLLFLFGDKSDPRVLPLATLANGQIKPIVLDSSGWRNFDHLYFAAGAHLPLYQGGKQIGDALALWSKALAEPLYPAFARPIDARTLVVVALAIALVAAGGLRRREPPA